MVDKLSELRAKCGVTPRRYGSTDSVGRRSSNSSVGMTAQHGMMPALVATYNELLPMVNGIRDVSDRIRDLTRQGITATSADKERKIANAVSRQVDIGKRNTMRIKDIITELKRLENEERDEMTPAESQMVTSMIRSTSLTFKNNLTDYMKAQEDYKLAVKQKVERQLRIAYPDAKETEIRELADEDPMSVREAIMQQLKSGGQNTLHVTLRDLHEKYSDMKKLEESVMELHDLFLFLSALVDEQAQMLDSIEANVENTKEYTGVAVEHIVQAKRHKEALDQKRWWLMAFSWGGCIVVTLIILFCLAPYVSFLSWFIPWGRSSSSDSGAQVPRSHKTVAPSGIAGAPGAPVGRHQEFLAPVQSSHGTAFGAG
ncbi:unnamed protein product [Amoebophrya sp. A25]|nr:unnamed protein product [Amoebophrya sp. A25]|eukprot:GSA25T00021173001.1